MAYYLNINIRLLKINTKENQIFPGESGNILNRNHTTKY